MKKVKAESSLKNENKQQFFELDRLILRLSKQFAGSSATEIEEKIGLALQQIVECLDIGRCTFWEVSEDETELRCIRQYVVPKLEKVYGVTPQQSPWISKDQWNGNCSCNVRNEDPVSGAKTNKDASLLLGGKSFIISPFHIAGKAVAGMTFSTLEEDREFSPELVSRLNLIGEIITGAFYRKKIEEKYQQSLGDMRQQSGPAQAEDFPLREDTKKEFRYQGIIGNSEAMQNVFIKMEQVAPTDSVVLILGETGTGKGVLARTIHELSNRNKKRIVTVNCAALTPNLIESELFGREKGAYTGSTEMQIGRFELADKGTLVLDEFTELPLDLQAKLLRAIQEGEFERLGSPRTIRVDVRILALTSRNLKEEVSKGRFRQDLYYRLDVFPITMPPLRERFGDIPLLVEHFVEQFNRKMQKEIKNIPGGIMAQLMKYPWPGNVRELEHIIERSVIVTHGTSLQLAEKLEDHSLGLMEENAVTNLAEVEKRHIIKILEKTNWRIDGSKGAAVLLGLHPNTLRGRMQKLGIRLQKIPS